MFRPLHLVPTAVTWSIPRCPQLNALTHPLRDGCTPSGRSLVPSERPGSEKGPRRPGPALSVPQANREASPCQSRGALRSSFSARAECIRLMAWVAGGGADSRASPGAGQDRFQIRGTGWRAFGSIARTARPMVHWASDTNKAPCGCGKPGLPAAKAADNRNWSRQSPLDCTKSTRRFFRSNRFFHPPP